MMPASRCRKMLSGASVSSVGSSGSRNTAIASTQSAPMNRPSTSRRSGQGDLDRGGDQKPGCRGGEAAEQMAHHQVVGEAGVDHAKADHDGGRHRDQPEDRGDGAGNAAKLQPDRDRHVDDVAAGQELAEPEQVGELGAGEPAALLHHHVARQRQHAAEAGQSEDEEAREQLADIGRLVLGGEGGGGCIHRRVGSVSCRVRPEPGLRCSKYQIYGSWNYHICCIWIGSDDRAAPSPLCRRGRRGRPYHPRCRPPRHPAAAAEPADPRAGGRDRRAAVSPATARGRTDRRRPRLRGEGTRDPARHRPRRRSGAPRQPRPGRPACDRLHLLGRPSTPSSPA